jgi:CBS domain-containing protein
MQLVGIVTVADILRKFLYNGIKPVHETLGEMNFSPAITCNYDDLLSHVWKRMDESGYSGLPVMKKEKLIGIITRMDIIRSGHVRVGFDSNTRDAILVEKVMKTPPVVATPQTPVREAGEIILEYDIGRIPVVENPVYVKREPRRAKEADLVGIVSREDILWSYLN